MATPSGQATALTFKSWIGQPLVDPVDQSIASYVQQKCLILVIYTHTLSQ